MFAGQVLYENAFGTSQTRRTMERILVDYKSALKYILSFTDYEKSLAALYSPGNVDLGRVRELLERIGSPHIGSGIVHVAGTKGKGSTAAMIASVLKAAGYRTGLYTSPHLHTFRERIKVDDQMISPEDFALILEELIPEVEDINRKGEHGTLTTFEILTALALLYFRRQGVQIEVLEVGVGGRLDATNVVQANVCVITSISNDHTELLGSTLAEITQEKAAIIKPGSAVVTAPQKPDVDTVLTRVCAANGARQIRAGTDIVWEIMDSSRAGQQFRVYGPSGHYTLKIPLLGDHQLENAAVAIGAVEELIRLGWTIPTDSIYRGLQHLCWPGRLQILSENPLLIADGAHNGYSAGKLRESLSKYFQFEKVVFIVGVSSDKNLQYIADELLPIASRVIATRSHHPRAASVPDVASVFRQPGIIVEVADGVEQALRMAYDLAGPKDLICATGSLFIVGEVIEVIRRMPAESYSGLPGPVS